MAVCASCGKEIPENETVCSACGEREDDPKVAVLKHDIEEFVREESPADLAAAQKELEQWKAPEEREEAAGEPTEPPPVVLARAPDEMWARMLAGWLEGEGLEVMLESKVVPQFASATTVSEGYWGDVLVHARDLDRAREILTLFEEERAGAGEGAQPMSFG